MNQLFFDIKDVLSESGCPVCLLRYRYEGQYLDTLFYENVNDPDLREKLRRNGGFCSSHVKLIYEKKPSVLGISIVFSDLINNIIFEGEAPESHCPLCRGWKQKEVFIHRVLRDHWNEFKKVWGKRTFLCRKHLKTLPWEEGVRQEMTAFTERSLTAITQDLSTFIRKFDYLAPTGSISKEESMSWQEVLEFFAHCRLRKKTKT